MSQGAKHFAQKLNQCLQETGAPPNVRERAAILSKLLDIPKHQAWRLVEGQETPDTQLLQKIAAEFEVDPEWLTHE